MHLCVLMRRIWRDAGLYDSRKAGVQAFLAFIAEQPDRDWKEGVQAFRAYHYDVFNDVVPPLLAADDKLLRLALIRSANVKQRRELNLLKKFVQEADPEHDEPELLAILDLGHKGLINEIGQRTDLTSTLRNRVP